MIDIDRLQKQSGIIGTSDGIRQVLEMIAQVAPVDISALITGESGGRRTCQDDGRQEHPGLCCFRGCLGGPGSAGVGRGRSGTGGQSLCGSVLRLATGHHRRTAPRGRWLPRGRCLIGSTQCPAGQSPFAAWSRGTSMGSRSPQWASTIG